MCCVLVASWEEVKSRNGDFRASQNCGCLLSEHVNANRAYSSAEFVEVSALVRLGS